MSNAATEKLTNGDTNTTQKVTPRKLRQIQLKADRNFLIIAS